MGATTVAPSVESLDDAIEHEDRAFHDMLGDLLKKYENEYVAIYDGELVGHDLDESNLVSECYGRFGDVPFYIARVTREPEVLEFTGFESVA